MVAALPDPATTNVPSLRRSPPRTLTNCCVVLTVTRPSTSVTRPISDGCACTAPPTMAAARAGPRKRRFTRLITEDSGNWTDWNCDKLYRTRHDHLKVLRSKLFVFV